VFAAQRELLPTSLLSSGCSSFKYCFNEIDDYVNYCLHKNQEALFMVSINFSSLPTNQKAHLDTVRPYLCLVRKLKFHKQQQAPAPLFRYFQDNYLCYI